MKTEKLYIKALQNISFKAFAIVAYIILFVVQRRPQMSIDAVELHNVTEKFSLSDIAFGNISKFFDYFAAEVTASVTVITVLAVIALLLGVISLALSLFGFKRVQLVNFCVSLAGTIISAVFAIVLAVNLSALNKAEAGEILDFTAYYFSAWLPVIFFAIGTVFTYAYVKMPNYTLSEGRFFVTLGCALNPINFVKTFSEDDDTEALFRARIPLKKKKYATMSEPAAIKNAMKNAKKSSKRHSKSNKNKIDEKAAQTESKLTPLQLALSKREHAEKIANVNADAENRALFSKKQKTVSRTKPVINRSDMTNPEKSKKRGNSSGGNALEIAKLKARHAEEIASKNNQIFN